MDLKYSPELSPFILSDVARTEVVLGSGSFGFVEEVSLNGATCAGKKMHDILMQSKTQDKSSLTKKLESECRLMSKLKHPNIVQFFGLYFYENSNYPMIVMEKLDSNLDSVLTSGKIISFAVKKRLMQDIAKGLDYLHSQVPPVIHRDLTARNVLITSTMQAKLADLGNAHIVHPHQIWSTLSQMPGTMVYMPPEAMQSNPSYSTSLDAFSYGHLILFIILQEFPGDILPYTYPNPRNPEKPIGRSEIERRKKYINQCVTTVGSKNPIIQLINQCLSNNPQARPTAKQMLEKLTESECEEEQVYSGIKTHLKFHTNEILGIRENQHEEQPAMLSHSGYKLQNIKSGEPMVLDKLTSIKQGFRRYETYVWEPYVFQIDSFKLKYFSDLKKKKTLGQIDLSDITRVIKKSSQRCHYPFEIYFNGKTSPWTLRSKIEDTRNCWMDSIKPNSSQQPELDSLNSDNQTTIDEAVTQNQYVYSTHVHSSEKALAENTTEAVYEEVNIKHLRTDQEAKDPKYDTPLEAEFSDLTDEQVEHIYQALYKVVNHRKRSTESTNEVETEKDIKQDNKHADNLTEHSITKPQPLPRKTNIENSTQHQISKEEVKGRPPQDSKQERKEYSDNQDHGNTNNDIPPPLPPKKRRIKKQPDTTYQEVKQDSYPPTDKFRERVMATGSRRNKSIRRINDLRVQLSAHQDSSEESGDTFSCPQWGRARANATNSIKEEEGEEEDVELPNDFFLESSSIHILNLIGVGNFGKVFRGTLTANENTTEVAVKIVLHKSEKERRNFKQEMIIMSQVMHPNVVRLFGLIPQENMIVLEYMSGGNLKHFLQKNSRPVGRLVKYMKDIVIGMHHLSEMGLVHRDLAARNILVGEGELCKVSDLGQMIEIPKDGDNYCIITDTSKIPIRWCAPEYLREKKCSTASDVWSFGVLMWEMMNPERLPYENYNNKEVMRKIKAGYTLTIPSEYPKEIQDIMKLCWNKEPEKRPGFLYIFLKLRRISYK